jgi:hypothetical protein
VAPKFFKSTQSLALGPISQCTTKSCPVILEPSEKTIAFPTTVLDQSWQDRDTTKLRCLNTHRHTGLRSAKYRIYSSYAIFLTGMQSIPSLEIGMTLENLGTSVLILENLKIGMAHSDVNQASIAGSWPSELEQTLQSVGRLVALPGELIVVSSRHLSHEVEACLWELLDFSLNSPSDINCIVRSAADSTDICRRVVEPLQSHCGQ